VRVRAGVRLPAGPHNDTRQIFAVKKVAKFA
jgi:hypothetical protein